MKREELVRRRNKVYSGVETWYAELLPHRNVRTGIGKSVLYGPLHTDPHKLVPLLTNHDLHRS